MIIFMHNILHNYMFLLMIIDFCYENIDNPLYFLIYRLRGFMVNQPACMRRKRNLKNT